MRNRGNVFNQRYLKTDCLQCADRGFTAGSGSLDVNFYFAQTMLHSRFGSGFGGGLSRERGALAGTSESEAARACPRNRVSVQIRDRNDRVVERGANMGGTDFNVFLDDAFSDAFLYGRFCQLYSLLTSCLSSCPRQTSSVLYGFSRSVSCSVRVPGDLCDDESLCSS